jgi:hypothetical protein
VLADAAAVARHEVLALYFADVLEPLALPYRIKDEAHVSEPRQALRKALVAAARLAIERMPA